MQTIGERLEEARKKKGISIREAAEATKIRGDFLQKFEGNHFDIGLTEIYVRGFLRNYAQFLKVPSERLLNDYAALGRGDGRPRTSNRESYGRTDVERDETPEIEERTESPAVEHELPEGQRAPRRGRGSRNLPTGPDPAVVFRWVKWGAVGLIALIAALVIYNYRSGNVSPATPAVSRTTDNSSPTSNATLNLIATGDVQVVVSTIDSGQEIYRGLLARGQTRIVNRPAALYISANPGENLTLEISGKRYPFGLQGDARGKLPAPR